MTLSISRDNLRSGMLKNQSRSLRLRSRDGTGPFRTLLLGLGEDPDREGLTDTPKRVVKALKFLTSGYFQSLDDLLNGAVFDENINEMVMVRDIDLFSSCEHHILPILGRAHIAYISQTARSLVCQKLLESAKCMPVDCKCRKDSQLKSPMP